MKLCVSRRSLLGGLGTAAALAAIAPGVQAQVTAPAPAPVVPRPATPQQPAPQAQPAPQPAPTTAVQTDADRADIARVEEYLNSIRTLRARFIQLTQTGGRSQGTFYLSRPGRLRLEYDPPVPTILIANGGMLQHYDSQLRQPQFIPLDSTPATYLVRDQLRLAGDIAVVSVGRAANRLDVTIVKTRDPREGRITFTFQTQPFQLVNWIVQDSQGRSTRVVLNEVQVGMPLDNALFRHITDVGQVPQR